MPLVDHQPDPRLLIVLGEDGATIAGERGADGVGEGDGAEYGGAVAAIRAEEEDGGDGEGGD